MTVEWTDELRAKAPELLGPDRWGITPTYAEGYISGVRGHEAPFDFGTVEEWLQGIEAGYVTAAVARWCGENPDRRKLYVFTLLAICNPDGDVWYVTAYQSGLNPDVDDCFAIDQATPEQRLYALAKAALESA